MLLLKSNWHLQIYWAVTCTLDETEGIQVGELMSKPLSYGKVFQFSGLHTRKNKGTVIWKASPWYDVIRGILCWHRFPEIACVRLITSCNPLSRLFETSTINMIALTCNEAYGIANMQRWPVRFCIFDSLVEGFWIIEGLTKQLLILNRQVYLASYIPGSESFNYPICKKEIQTRVHILHDMLSYMARTPFWVRHGQTDFAGFV